MKVGILQAGRSPENLRDQHGDYDEMSRVLLGIAPQQVEYYAVLDGEFPDDPESCDVWFVTGSRHGVYEDHAWIPPLEAFLNWARVKDKKIVGICFGHQIMAQAFGGKVIKSDKGWGIGALDYELLDDQGHTTGITTQCAWHQDQVVELPPGVDVIARSEFCAYAGLAYGDWGLSYQPHPEFTPDYLRDLVTARMGDTISTEIGQSALRSLEKPVKTDIQKHILEFIHAE